MICRAASQVAWELNSCMATPVFCVGAALDVGLAEMKNAIKTYINCNSKDSVVCCPLSGLIFIMVNFTKAFRTDFCPKNKTQNFSKFLPQLAETIFEKH